MDKDGYHGYYRFEHPPQRKWVGLTEKEKEEAYFKIDTWSECIAFIEAKLKEKNT